MLTGNVNHPIDALYQNINNRVCNIAIFTEIIKSSLYKKYIGPSSLFFFSMFMFSMFMMMIT